MNKDLLTLLEVSAKYKISIHTLHYYVYSKKLKTVRIGRRHYVNENDLFNIYNTGAANND